MLKLKIYFKYLIILVQSLNLEEFQNTYRLSDYKSPNLNKKNNNASENFMENLNSKEDQTSNQ